MQKSDSELCAPKPDKENQSAASPINARERRTQLFVVSHGENVKWLELKSRWGRNRISNRVARARNLRSIRIECGNGREYCFHLANYRPWTLNLQMGKKSNIMGMIPLMCPSVTVAETESRENLLRNFECRRSPADLYTLTRFWPLSNEAHWNVFQLKRQLFWYLGITCPCYAGTI